MVVVLHRCCLVVRGWFWWGSFRCRACLVEVDWHAAASTSEVSGLIVTSPFVTFCSLHLLCGTWRVLGTVMQLAFAL